MRARCGSGLSGSEPSDREPLACSGRDQLQLYARGFRFFAFRSSLVPSVTVQVAPTVEQSVVSAGGSSAFEVSNRANSFTQGASL